jgi:hypothetical protein
VIIAPRTTAALGVVHTSPGPSQLKNRQTRSDFSEPSQDLVSRFQS